MVTPQVTARAVVIPAEVVAALPWDGTDWGGESRLLWEDRASGSVAGVLALGPGDVHTRHAHPDITHHIWVLSGTYRIGDDVLGRGSYACMPAGQPHGPESAGPEGCQLFYVLVPTPAS